MQDEDTLRDLIRVEKPLLPYPQAPSDDCSLVFADIHTWSLHAVQFSLSLLALVLNCVLTLIVHEAAPIPYPQRRQVFFDLDRASELKAAICINFSVLAGIQLARNVFLFLSLYRPCLQLTNTTSCKLQAFPLFFCYLQAGLLICVISIRINTPYKKARHPIRYEWLCSIWQVITAAVAMGLTLLFTAFDSETKSLIMKQCSPLLALRERERSFWLLTILIGLHAFAVITVSLNVTPNPSSFNRRTVFARSLRDVITLETLSWQLAMLMSGGLVLYRFVMLKPCEECVRVGLELSFVTIPLFIAFLHPIFLIWFVYPVRDAMVRVYPAISSVLPEYALVPPPPPHGKAHKIRRSKRASSITDTKDPLAAVV